MVDAFLDIKYVLDKTDKFDEYMKAVGVGAVTRKIGNTITPGFEVRKEGDEYVILLTSTFKNEKVKFKPGVEVSYDTPDGRKVKSVFTINGATIAEVQTDNNGKVSYIDRTWSADGITMILKVDDVVCTRIYKRK